ncbi:MAG: 3-deoxy-7-phosphoheptulonate synthase [Peptacetobacter hiranonis]|nr:3-deoxy-7-phosphoheptulonate synthase [Peptacetobacter hiranonis]MED9946689.1 3-deoxy-7-phosphoheptulonate synthase [Peptacetobacter hiranonis]
MKERAFVLRPLLDLSKELDINGENVLEAFNRLPDEEKRNIEEFEIDENNPFSQQKKIIVNREKGIEFGKDNIVIAGPCAIESYEQFLKTAEFVKSQGADILRGGAYKPRTSSFSFNGLKEEGLEILKEVRKKTKMPVITELMDIRDLEKVYDATDIIQIGSRNMQNFPLLSEAGKQDKPVMLKRGLAATINEWICSAEYIAVEGNEKIIMCERGIRTYDDYTRNTLDLAAVPIIKKETGLPVIVDPSHGTGIRELVAPMSYAALACGADGIMVEVHPNPDEALSDGEQSLDFDNFEELMEKIKKNYKNL